MKTTILEQINFLADKYYRGLSIFYKKVEKHNFFE